MPHIRPFLYLDIIVTVFAAGVLLAYLPKTWREYRWSQENGSLDESRVGIGVLLGHLGVISAVLAAGVWLGWLVTRDRLHFPSVMIPLVAIVFGIVRSCLLLASQYMLQRRHKRRHGRLGLGLAPLPLLTRPWRHAITAVSLVAATASVGGGVAILAPDLPDDEDPTERALHAVAPDQLTIERALHTELEPPAELERADPRHSPAGAGSGATQAADDVEDDAQNTVETVEETVDQTLDDVLPTLPPLPTLTLPPPPDL